MDKLYEDVPTTVRKYNVDAIKQLVNDYLKDNQIAGDEYICTRIEHSDSGSILIHLIYSDDTYVDESFTSDSDWKTFCEELGAKLDTHRVAVPYWYYPK